jgi:ankyrin repeat protein
VLRNESEELIALVKSGDAAAVGLALPTKQRPVYDPHPKVHADTVRREPDAHCRNSARINWRDAHGFTALHWACQRGHARIALRLVQLGACENGRFAGGTTPLQIAHMHGRAKGLEVQIRRLVDQRAAIDRRLHVAASRGKTDEVLALLRGNHPLSSCAELEVAQIGADPVICASVNAAEPQTRRSGGGETALHDAASFCHNSTVAALLRSGAWVDARDGLGWTALHRACAVSPPVASTARLLIAAATLAIELGALDGAVLPGGDVSGTRGALDATRGVWPAPYVGVAWDVYAARWFFFTTAKERARCRNLSAKRKQAGQDGAECRTRMRATAFAAAVAHDTAIVQSVAAPRAAEACALELNFSSAAATARHSATASRIFNNGHIGS